MNRSYNLARLTNSKIVLLSVDESNPPFDKKAFDEIPNVEIIVRKGNVYEEINKVADEMEKGTRKKKTEGIIFREIMRNILPDQRLQTND